MTENSDQPIGSAVWARHEGIYSSVGQAISMWASMEGGIVEIAAMLLGTSEHKTGLMLYSINNFFAWLTIVDELYNLEPTYKEHRREWGDCSSVLRTLNDTRVRLAHHTVWDHPSENCTGLRPGRLDTRTKSRKHGPLTDGEIITFTQNVLAIGDKLAKLLNAMRATKDAAQKTWLEKYSLLKLGQTTPQDAQQLHSPTGESSQPQASEV